MTSSLITYFGYLVVVGVVSSLATALLILIGNTGLNLTRASRAQAREQRRAEEAQWRTGKQAEKQKITNRYLFTILRLFFLGSLFASTPILLSPTYFLFPSRLTAVGVALFSACLGAVGLTFYCLAVGHTFRYKKLLDLE
jgi:predicted RND superfamily exporter protein